MRPASRLRSRRLHMASLKRAPFQPTISGSGPCVKNSRNGLSQILRMARTWHRSGCSQAMVSTSTHGLTCQPLVHWIGGTMSRPLRSGTLAPSLTLTSTSAVVSPFGSGWVLSTKRQSKNGLSFLWKLPNTLLPAHASCSTCICDRTAAGFAYDVAIKHLAAVGADPEMQARLDQEWELGRTWFAFSKRNLVWCRLRGIDIRQRGKREQDDM